MEVLAGRFPKAVSGTLGQGRDSLELVRAFSEMLSDLASRLWL
jgi:hypothetical protein